jgi:hypothetical protein
MERSPAGRPASEYLGEGRWTPPFLSHHVDPGLPLRSGWWDLADSEARRSHLFLPLDDLESVLHSRHSEQHERTEQWLMGKPLASNISHIIRTPEQLTALRERAIPLRRRHFRHEEMGLLCTAERSFSPTFDGASVVEVAHLEQGLALAVKGGAEAAADAGDPVGAVRGQRHVLAISDAAYERCAGRLNDLSDHLVLQGRMPLEAKELQWEARVYGLPMPTGRP